MMKKILMMGLLGLLGTSVGFAGDHDPRHIGILLGQAKISLLEAIEHAERISGVATSAKYEIEDGKLMMSVYTVPQGLGVEPESATLTEVSGQATLDPYSPSVEIFTDAPHIARATVHMTLFQLSKLNIQDVIKRALAAQPGTPIDIRNPMVRNGKAVADVVILDAKAEPHIVSVAL